MPEPSTASDTRAIVATFTFTRIMVRNAPSVSAATVAETTAFAAFPAANGSAALMVERVSEAGTAADAALWDRIVRTRDRECDAAPGQASAEPFPAARQSRQDGPLGTAELHRRFFVGAPFEIAQDKGSAILLGETGDFLVEDGPEIAPVGVFRCGCGQIGRGRTGSDRSFTGRGAQSQGDAVRDPVQPAADRIAPANRPRLPAKTRKVAWNASSAS